MTYSEADMIEAFQRGYAAQYFRGNINDVDKLDGVSLRASREICERWLTQL